MPARPTFDGMTLGSLTIAQNNGLLKKPCPAPALATARNALHRLGRGNGAAVASSYVLIGVPEMPFELTTRGAVMFARLFGVFTAPELNHMAAEA